MAQLGDHHGPNLAEVWMPSVLQMPCNTTHCHEGTLHAEVLSISSIFQPLDTAAHVVSYHTNSRAGGAGQGVVLQESHKPITI